MPPEAPPLEQRHILIVEDSAYAIFLKRVLEESGATTTRCTEVAEARQSLGLDTGVPVAPLPDACLLDFELLDTPTGSELANELRSCNLPSHSTYQYFIV